MPVETLSNCPPELDKWVSKYCHGVSYCKDTSQAPNNVLPNVQIPHEQMLKGVKGNPSPLNRGLFIYCGKCKLNGG